MGTKLDMIGIFVSDLSQMVADPDVNFIEVGSWNRAAESEG